MPITNKYISNDVELKNHALVEHMIEDQLAHFLLYKTNSNNKEPSDNNIGILIENPINQVVAVKGVLNAGYTYVSIDTKLPEHKIKLTIDEAKICTLISEGKWIKTLNRLQWDCPSLNNYICLDVESDIYEIPEVVKNKLMNKNLWEYVGVHSTDSITAGGWNNSYNGEPFSFEEMEEYGNNALRKLEPYLHENTRVLEIGCSSGITMFRIAPKVEYYFGIDISQAIIEKNITYINENFITNIKLDVAEANQIDSFYEKDFDIVIINSVIQCFHGHNYLRKVINKAISKLKDDGVIFLGDIMDNDCKELLVASTTDYYNKHHNIKTKYEWDEELFLSKNFFYDLQYDIDSIMDVLVSNKLYTIENELTKFRYDVLITINKNGRREPKGEKYKNQYCLKDIHNASLRSLPTTHKKNIQKLILEEWGKII